MNFFYSVNCLLVPILINLDGLQEASAGEGLTPYSFLFGMASDDVQQIQFLPEDGARFRKKYEEKHGPRGMHLIEKFGQGYSQEGPSVLDPDVTFTKPAKKKTKRYGTKIANSTPTAETTTIQSTMSTDYETTTTLITNHDDHDDDRPNDMMTTDSSSYDYDSTTTTTHPSIDYETVETTTDVSLHDSNEYDDYKK